MTTIYTGSNYGVISTSNSGSGTLNTSTTYDFTYELVSNYTSGSILLSLKSNNISNSSLCSLSINYSNDASGTIVSTETHKNLLATHTNPTVTTIEFKPKAKYLQLQLQNVGLYQVAFTIQTRYNNSADPEQDGGVISSANSFYYPTGLSTNQPVSGTYEDVSTYSMITIMTNGTAVTAPVSLSIECVFSTDGINEDRIVSYLTQDVTANGSTSATTSLTFNPAHTLLPISRYFKVRFTTDATNASTSLRFTTTYHTHKSKPLTSRVTQNLTDQFDADTARSILVGRTLGTLLPQGHYQNISVQNNAIATMIRDPTSAFGELLTSQLTPLIQFDFSNGEPYEVIAPIYRNSSTKTSYSYSNAFLNLDVSGADSIIQCISSEYTKYKPGQGIDARLTAVFNTATNGSQQYIGLFTPENSLTFGYFDVSGVNTFCIGYAKNGLQQIVDLTISGTSNGNAIVLNFGGTVVTTTQPLTAGNNAVQAAAAISKIVNATLGLNKYNWTSSYFSNDASGTTATVRLIRLYAASPDISVTVTTPSGYTITPSTVRSGVSQSITYFPQSQWNMDRCTSQGSLQANYLYNSSGFQLDPTKGNVYRIVFQYLGFGAITFFIENPETGMFMPVHQIKYANSYTSTSVLSPNYKIGYCVENITNTSKVTIKCASIAAFVQGAVVPAPLYRSYPNFIQGNALATISKPNARVIFGFRVLSTKTSTNSDATLNTTINRSNLFLNSMSCALNVTFTGGGGASNANIVFQLVKNPTGFYLGNPSTTIYNPVWRQYELDGSILVFDGSVTTSTTTGIGYTGGFNVFDIPLVENTANTYDLRTMLVNVAADDIYLVTIYGNTTGVTTYDVLASISYQINN